MRLLDAKALDSDRPMSAKGRENGVNRRVWCVVGNRRLLSADHLHFVAVKNLRVGKVIFALRILSVELPVSVHYLLGNKDWICPLNVRSSRIPISRLLENRK